MKVYLVNPSDVSFGVGVITPRWLYVLAGATPRSFGDPVVIDESLEAFQPERIRPGDIVGIGIHTSNAHRGYELGRLVRRRGGIPVFGGIHATLFPEESFEYGQAESVVKRDGDLIWATVLSDWTQRRMQRIYDGGMVDGADFASARWDLLSRKSYMWASVQTTRGCPKHCSFCSVWRTDGQFPRLRPVNAVIDEVVALRRMGFRFIALADDNFYPVTLHDLHTSKLNDKSRYERLSSILVQRYSLMHELSRISAPDLILFTQITMEAAENPEFLKAMQAARIRGALVGVESITQNGLAGIYKGFNFSGEDLVTRMQTFRKHGVYVLGSFIFGLPTDTEETFSATADLADRSGMAFAQFVPLTPFPGTIDFENWEKNMAASSSPSAGIPVTRHWLLPAEQRPKLYIPHPTMPPDEIRTRTQKVWDSFYDLPKIWRRSQCASSRLRWRLAFLLISKLYCYMYARTGIATDSARQSLAVRWARLIAKPCIRLFAAKPMKELQPPPAIQIRKSMPEALGSD